MIWIRLILDDMDSVDFTIRTELISVYASSKNMFNYYSNRDKVVWPDAISQHKHKRDSIAFSKNDYDPALINAKPVLAKPDSPDMPVTYLQYSDHNRYQSDSIFRGYQSDSIFRAPYSESELASALTQARTAKAQLLTNNANLKAFKNEKRIFYIQWHKIMAQAIACIAMFLIGAPLGAIIKKGGLGVPVLMSILFFILFYVLSLMGEKWAKQSVLSVETGMWLANVTLFIIGFMFLRQARADARLFFYGRPEPMPACSMRIFIV